MDLIKHNSKETRTIQEGKVVSTFLGINVFMVQTSAN